MKNLKAKNPTMIDRAQARIAAGTTNEAVRQGRKYFGELLEVTGRLIFLCSYRLILAVIKGIYSGITTFFREMGK